MIIPDETDLFWLFGCQPEILDNGVPLYYNTIKYTYINQSNECLVFTIYPSFNEINLKVKTNTTNELISELELKDIKSLEILYNQKNESQIMITSDHNVFIISIKPKFKIFIS